MTEQEREARDWPEGFLKEAAEEVRTEPEWRVGNHQRQNLYQGRRYAGVMFHPDDAARVVAALNLRQEFARQLAGAVQRLDDDLAQDTPEALMDRLTAAQAAVRTSYLGGQVDALTALAKEADATGLGEDLGGIGLAAFLRERAERLGGGNG